MASTVQRDPVGSISGFVIVLLVFIFGSFIPAPLWVRLAVLAVATLLAVKGGVSGLDVITLGFVLFMMGGSLISGAYTATTEARIPTLKEPIPVPSEYGFTRDDSDEDGTRTYKSDPIPVKTAKQAISEANQAVAEIVDYYIAGLPPEWSVVDRTEDLGYGDTLNAQAKFRLEDTSTGIGIQVYADVWGRSATVILMIQALNCGEDVPGLPSGEVCWQGPV
jgi:hypothetical protein